MAIDDVVLGERGNAEEAETQCDGGGDEGLFHGLDPVHFSGCWCDGEWRRSDLTSMPEKQAIFWNVRRQV